MITKIDLMIHAIKSFPCFALAGLLPMFLFCCKGGDSSSEEKGSVSSSIPEHIRQHAYNTELSKTEGVSIIRRPEQANGWSINTDGYGGRKASVSSSQLGEIIYKLTEFEGLIYIDAELPEEAYDVEINAPEGKTFAELAKTAFETTFGLIYNEIIESTDVWILERDEAKPLAMEPVESDSSNWGTAQTPGGFGYEFRAGSAENLADILGKYLEGGIVLDETNLEGHYKFLLSMDHWKPETAVPGVEKLGLKVIRAKRDLPVLRVDYKNQP